MNHNFHFVLTENLKNRIDLYSLKINKSLSDAIAELVNKSYSIMKNFIYFFDKEENSGYKKIEACVQMHVILDKKDYNLLSLIQSNFGFFSKAVILRKIIEICLDKIEKFGVKRFEKMLKRYNLKFLKKIKSKKIFNKNPTIHMYSKKRKYSIFTFEYTNFYELSIIKILDFE